MAKKKKAKGQGESEIQAVGDVQDTAPDAVAGQADGGQAMSSAAPLIPDLPVVPVVPDLPPPPGSGAMPPPPPPRTAGMKAFDLPPIKGLSDAHVPAGNGVLKGILERTRGEVENEAMALMDSLKVQQDAARLAREEEERHKAAEARARVDAERKKRETALKEYEARQRMKDEAAKPKDAVSAATGALPVQKKGGKGWIFAVVAAVLVIGGGVTYFMMPKVAPVDFMADSTIERAHAGMILNAPVAWGPSTLRNARTVDADTLVAAVNPGKYEAEPPAPPVERRRTAPTQNRRLINIRTGIIGGNTVVH